jgi:hypothetical protein
VIVVIEVVWFGVVNELGAHGEEIEGRMTVLVVMKSRNQAV